MAFKMTLWVLALMFVATMVNVVSAYSAMESSVVQGKFQQIGLLVDGKTDGIPVPPRKPLQTAELAAN